MKKLLASLILLVSTGAHALVFETNHPRTLAKPADWATAAAKASGTAAEQEQYDDFIAYIDANCPASTASNKQGCALPMAMAYAYDPITYGGAFADKACTLIKFIVDRDNGDEGNTTTGGWLDTDSEIKSGNSFRWYATGTAVAWDLVGEHCDTVDTTVGDKVRYMAEYAWDFLKPDSVIANGKYSILLTPYKANNNIGIGQVEGMMKLAFALYDSSTYTAPEIWVSSTILHVVEPYILPCLLDSSADAAHKTCYGGSFQEGMSEYGPETLTRTIDALDAFRVGTTDIDYWPLVSTTTFKYMTEFFANYTSPTGPMGNYYKLYQPYIYRDVTAHTGPAYYGFFWFPPREAVVRMTYHMDRLGITPYADYGQWWIKNIQPKYWVNTNNNVGFEGFDLLFENPNDAGTDYRSTSLLTPYHETPFMLLSRSSWTESATWAGFTAMIEGADHHHADQGSFNIYRNGRWLTREVPGYLNLTTVSPSSAHNVLTMNGHGSASGATRGGGSFSGIPKMLRGPNKPYTYCNDSYCSAAADISPSYKFTGYQITPDVSSATRRFMHIKPDFFAVSDSVKYVPNLNAPTIFHLQTDYTSAAIGTTSATITNGSQSLQVTPIAPSTRFMYSINMSSCMIADAQLQSQTTMHFYLDCGHGLGNGTVFGISGFTGDYAIFNGTHAVSNPAFSTFSSPYQDGVSYNGERVRVLLSTNSTALWDVPAYDPSIHGVAMSTRTRSFVYNDPDVTPLSPGAYSSKRPNRMDIHSGRRVNQEHFFVILEGKDTSASPTPVTALSSPDGTASGASFTPPGGSLVEVMTTTTSAPSFPIKITRTGSPSTQYWMGLAAETNYYISDSGGVTTLATSAGGTQVTSDTSGVVVYSMEGGGGGAPVTGVTRQRRGRAQMRGRTSL